MNFVFGNYSRNHNIKNLNYIYFCLIKDFLFISSSFFTNLVVYVITKKLM